MSEGDVDCTVYLNAIYLSKRVVSHFQSVTSVGCLLVVVFSTRQQAFPPYLCLPSAFGSSFYVKSKFSPSDERLGYPNETS